MRNARFGIESPEQSIPHFGLYIWEWFFDACEMRKEHDKPLSASDWQAWRKMTGYIIRPVEWKILRKMDQSYVASFLKEKQAAIQRSIEAANNG